MTYLSARTAPPPTTSTRSRGARVRSFGATLLLTTTLALLTAACDQPVGVTFNPRETKKLDLRGETDVVGELNRTLTYNGREFPKGSKVAVMETFMFREDGKTPPSYRVLGYWDPAKQSEGFVLPAGSVTVTYLSLLEPDRKQSVPVPAEYFVLPR